MSQALAQAVPETRLPRLGARWVSVYRTAWFMLALGAIGLLAASVLHPIAHPAILTLRLVKGAVLISVSAILLRRRGTDPVAALLSLAFLTWTITSSFDFASADVLPMLLDRVRFLLFALALLLFPDGNWRPAWTRWIAAASTGVFFLGIAEGIRLAPSHLFLPLAITCVIAAVSALVSRFRTAESETVRQQLKWVALGLVMGIGLILCARAGAAASAASPRLAPMPILWEAIFQLGIVVIALGFLTSLLRYRLFDAETAISRSAALAALTVTLVAVFAGTEATLENLGQAYLGMGIGNISAAMAAAIAAVLLNPLHARISNWAEHHFQRDLVLLKQQVPELVGSRAAGLSSETLGKTVLPTVNEAIHATRSAFLIDHRIVAVSGVDLPATRRWARIFLKGCDTARGRDLNDALFPLRMRLGSSFPGWLLLGPRPDGSLYGGDELAALRSIIPVLRQGFIWALNSEAMRATNLRANHRTRKEIEELRQRLGEVVLQIGDRANRPVRESRAPLGS